MNVADVDVGRNINAIYGQMMLKMELDKEKVLKGIKQESLKAVINAERYGGNTPYTEYWKGAKSELELLESKLLKRIKRGDFDKS